MTSEDALPPKPPGSILALDVGAKRIGVARASTIALLPEPLTTLLVTDQIYQEIGTLCRQEQASLLVVGLPQGLQGQNTAQTQAVQAFVTRLSHEVSIPVKMYNEAVTSKLAEEELSRRGSVYSKADIDALAATYILEGFIESHGHQLHGL